MKRLNLALSLLLDEMKKLNDEGREMPVRWHVMHMYSCSQLAKLLALKRGIDPELAGLAAALHDIAVIFSGKTEEHAKKAESYIKDLIKRINNGPWKSVPKIDKCEEDLLINAVLKHSQKDIDSKDGFIELLKDVDSLDRYLHGVKETKEEYIERYRNVLNELGIE